MYQVVLDKYNADLSPDATPQTAPVNLFSEPRGRLARPESAPTTETMLTGDAVQHLCFVMVAPGLFFPPLAVSWAQKTKK
jgi:hypothetical protein